jgi:cell division protein FtsQ
MVLTLLGCFAFLVVSSLIKQKEIVCKDVLVKVDHNDELYFLNENDIMKLLTKHGSNVLVNKKISEINLQELERSIELSDFVDKAEVFTNFEGAIKVKVIQKKPQYRIFNNQGVSYYISKNGTYIPFSSNFTPRLIVATGNVPFAKNIEEEPVNKSLKTLIDFIQKDEFLNALIGSVHVNSKKEFVLIPKIDGHKIEFGNTNNMETKFKNLKIFYKKALPNSAWEKYETINLKYKGQIVCSKK